MIGPNGKPAADRSDRHRRAGNAGAGAYAAARVPGGAARRQTRADPAQERHHLDAGLHARRRSSGCIYGSWYLLDTSARKGAVRGRQGDLRPEETEQNLYADGYKPPAGAKPKAVRVNPGTVLVQARRSKRAAGKVTKHEPEQLVRAQRRPGADRRDITNPQQSFDEGAGGTGAPNVTFGFTSHGKSVFEQVTKEIAHRGQEAQLPGVTKEAALQHFAVVLDGQLITAPVDRLHPVPRRDRRLQRLGDLRRLHDHLRAEPRRRAAVRRAADQAGADLPLAGLGDARQNRRSTRA